MNAQPAVWVFLPDENRYGWRVETDSEALRKFARLTPKILNAQARAQISAPIEIAHGG